MRNTISTTKIFTFFTLLLFLGIVEYAGASPPQISSESGTPSIKIVSPNGGEVWQTGQNYTILWTSQNLPSVAQNNINIVLRKTSDEYWSLVIRSGTINDGTEQWNIPSDLAPANDYKVDIHCVIFAGDVGLPCPFDQSDAPFTIVRAGSTLRQLGDEISNWKTYRNEQYGFEVKVPPTWKQCPDYQPEDIDFFLPIFTLVPSSAKCDSFTESIMVTREPAIVKQYPTPDKLIAAFEEARARINIPGEDTQFKIWSEGFGRYKAQGVIGLFEVGLVEKVNLGYVSAIRVVEDNPAGFHGATGFYIFKNNGLLRVAVGFDEEDPLYGEVKAFLSTFKFIPSENQYHVSNTESKESIEYTTPGGISPAIFRGFQWLIALLIIGAFIFKFRPHIFKVVFSVIFSVISLLLLSSCFITDISLPIFCEYRALFFPLFIFVDPLGDNIRTVTMRNIIMPIATPLIAFGVWYIIGSILFTLYSRIWKK